MSARAREGKVQQILGTPPEAPAAPKGWLIVPVYQFCCVGLRYLWNVREKHVVNMIEMSTSGSGSYLMSTTRFPFCAIHSTSLEYLKQICVGDRLVSLWQCRQWQVIAHGYVLQCDHRAWFSAQ